MNQKTVQKIRIGLGIIFFFAFYFGVFGNPNFNIHDFCLNLTSEILGIAITVTLVDALIRQKNK